MAVKIRLARLGCKNRTFYRIVAADSHTPRDDKHLQVVGFYDPLAAKGDARRLGLNVDLVKYWLSVGAQPIDTMHGILMRAGLISPPLMVVMEQKKGPADETSNLCIIYYGAEVNYPVKVTISTAFYVSSVLYLYA